MLTALDLECANVRRPIDCNFVLLHAELDQYAFFDNNAGDGPVGESPSPSQRSIPHAFARYISGT